jgi:hypothetical protein
VILFLPATEPKEHIIVRIYQQKQILNVLSTLSKAQKAALYADCQEGAIGVGEYIEEIEGEGTQTVTLLEEYCELLFKASLGEIGQKALSKQLNKVVNSVKNELKPTRIEIVFLSYKASMSDSIESIYMAAKEDPDCDVYWIPIPYYDRNPDGSFGTMRYEGQEYYKPTLECTDWREYNIEEKQPDVIFTFAPYDELGFVTSVHPDFYCRRLRELTGMLVYVPYFVAALEVGDPFTKSAGVMFSHLVIVQSEEIRQCYIRDYKELEKIGYSREIYGAPEKKIIALGSPKYDAVINAKREDFSIPDTWLMLIEKPDGTRKKTILYNTSISAFLNNSEHYLKKLKYVLESFSKRDDIVLWWRPHPLSSTALASMHPGLSHEYDKMVAEYKRDGFGIYDDTPDLHRAVVCTDAYYGDMSSLVVLCRVAGKPVVVQDVNVTENEVLLRFAGFAQDDEGRYWGFELLRDGLFRLDFNDNSAHCVAKSGCIPQYLGKKCFLSTHRYIDICCIDSKVICFPFFLDSIFIFDHANGSTDIVSLDRDYLLSPDSDGFALWFTALYDNEIYCFGFYSKAVIVFNTITHSVRYDTTLFDKIGLLINTGEYAKYPLYMSECSENGEITLLMRNCDSLISYNLQTQDIEYIATNPVLAKCEFADSDGNYFWVFTEDSTTLVKWNPISDITTKYSLSTDGFALPDIASSITGIVDCGEYILFYPGYASVIIRFDKQEEQFNEYKEMPVPEDEDNSIYKYFRPKRTGNKVYAFARYNGTMYELDTSSGEIKQHWFCLDKSSYEAFYSGFFDEVYANDYADRKANDIVYDSELGDIASFFAGALPKVHDDDYRIKSKLPKLYGYADGTAGKEIYRYVRKGIMK